MKTEIERIRDQLKCSLNMGGVKGSAEWAVGEIDRLLTSLPVGVPDVERLRTVFLFLDGQGELEGAQFDEKPVGYPYFWWRKHLREAVEPFLTAPTVKAEQVPTPEPKGGTFCRVCGTKLCVTGICTIYCPNRDCGVPGRGTKALTRRQLERLEAGIPAFDTADGALSLPAAGYPAGWPYRINPDLGRDDWQFTQDSAHAEKLGRNSNVEIYRISAQQSAPDAPERVSVPSHASRWPLETGVEAQQRAADAGCSRVACLHDGLQEMLAELATTEKLDD